MVNNQFAQRIMETYRDGNEIWIQDYHLMLLPSYLRRRLTLHTASIGFFLHTPFPSSEIYRMLPVRNEILHGLLSSSLIGFQMFEYARHFLTCCKRLLGLDYNSRRGGFLGLDYFGQEVMVRISHIGIDPNIFEARVRTDMIRRNVEKLSEEFKGCTVLLGVDNLDRLKGVGLKLLAMEALMRDYPRYRNHLCLIQVCIPRWLQNRDNRDAHLSAELKQHANRINSLYGNPATGYKPIKLIEKDISFDERITLYSIADGVLLTCIRDGLNLVPYEYLAAKTPNKKGILLISEFTGCSRSLSGAVRINPWSIDDVVAAIDKALSMNPTERKAVFEKDSAYVRKHTTTFWALNFLRDLERTATARHDSVTYLGVGLGHGQRVLDDNSLFNKIDFAHIIKAYQTSTRRLLFLDYEGTVATPLPVMPEPSASLRRNLELLCDDPCNTVFLISGRQRRVLAAAFGAFKKLGLAAEHGFFFKYPESEQWSQLVPGADFSWMDVAATVCEPYTDRTDGSQLEAKESALVWRYRDCDPDFGAMQAKQLFDHLQNVLAHFDVQVHHGKGAVEVYLRGINKGVVIDRVLNHQEQSGSSFDFVLCLGDDQADEDMFSMLHSRFPNSEPMPVSASPARAPAPADEDRAAVFTCTVGRKPSHAKFFVDDIDEANELLQALRFSAVKRNASAQELRVPQHK
eukprot:TRINITY_DN3030_c0_g1_i3.p1 TRINITY_DN3030_c0_g1~~TRINITY_DN3030_c0_g1_i3.p1  ORF type:complete len:687 (-),score=150.04 TRINITY_DN3030_c0_g1_i3:22-2082(-)